MIPKIIHFIWVGDESKRPDRFIQTWVDHHPGWEIKLWGNEDLASRPWINGHHMAEMAKREWNGVADLMRWEILHAEGGVLVDADSVCVRPLPEWLLECEAFACWENEIVRPGLIAAGYFGTIPGTAFLAALIEGIRQQPSVTDRQAWVSVGPLHLTKTWKAMAYGNLTLLPSHFFLPTHHTGLTYTGGGPVYALQAWASTGGTYDILASAGPSPQESPGQAGVEPTSQAFLFEPFWEDGEWREVLRRYLEVFTAEDSAILILLLNPDQPNQMDSATAQQSVLAIVNGLGRKDLPPVLVLNQPADLIRHLRSFHQASWIRLLKAGQYGLRGPLGQRLAHALSPEPMGSAP